MVAKAKEFSARIDSNLLKDHWNSLRRYFVDDFFSRHISSIANDELILDLGGIKNKKKGNFNIDAFDLNVVCGNYVFKTQPDICLDAHYLPVAADSFDCVICSELVEHVQHPDLVFSEIYRILKPGGRLFLTAPFLYPIHGDPFDYGRYTGQYYQEQLTTIGFSDISIEWHGGYWCVFVDMLRGWSMEKEASLTGIREKIMNWINVNIQPIIKKRALVTDQKGAAHDGFFMNGCTTGFGVVCRKDD